MVPERIAFSTKPEAKVLSTPTGNLNSNNLSINHLVEQQKAKAPAVSGDLPKKEFHKDDVIRLWKTMAHMQKLNGQDQVYHVMIKREPVQLDETTFQFEVDNTIQLTRLESAIGEVISYIRKEVQNYDLIIQLEMAKGASEEIKYLNGPDRFEKLAKKNSNLFDLKNRFNLDIDY
ncbi:hypothetical protein [Fluviicola sp.]|uniref:hypothetical protein n=1 Tax=Fluviicola sp. TaxID=1917219 RepID=UPI002826A097|nr:hypothetical protein [Fluviicola sp.]MDR0801854.1 hypothetical protein [Fluviicola sp.]